MRSFAFTFVCQKGELEIKSLLLAASLKRFLRCPYELVACIPTPEEIWGYPDQDTINLFNEMGVRLSSSTNPLALKAWSQKADPFFFCHANKIDCLAIRTTMDKILFLDTDIVLLREFQDDERFNCDINVKPRDYLWVVKDDDTWRRIYEEAGVAMPKERLLTTVSGESQPPTFNGGFIAINNGIKLSDTWWELALLTTQMKDFPKSEFWSDQISLAVAIQKLRLRYDCLDESYNFPAHARSIESNLPIFAHYHWPEVIARQPRLLRAVHHILRDYPLIAKKMKEDNNWKSIAEPISNYQTQACVVD